MAAHPFRFLIVGHDSEENWLRERLPRAEFAGSVAGIMADPAHHAQMRQAARSYALTASWDSVFEGVYAAYETMLPERVPAAE